MLKLHNLSNSAPRKPRKRVGRGNGNNWGRTCGRGEKGQKSRAGYSHRSYFEGGQIPFFRRIPKKGFKSPNRKVYALVNVRDLEARFESGDTVDIETVINKGMVGKIGAGLKILGNGEIAKSLTVKANCYSAAAREKIVTAGGTCETV